MFEPRRARHGGSQRRASLAAGHGGSEATDEPAPAVAIADDGTSTGTVTDGPVTTPTGSTAAHGTGTGSETGTDPDTSTGTDTTGAGADTSGSVESSTGDPLPVEGRARVLVHASLTDGPANALYRIDYENGVAGEPQLVSGEVNVTSARLSPGESIVLFEDGADTVYYASPRWEPIPQISSRRPPTARVWSSS